MTQNKKTLFQLLTPPMLKKRLSRSSNLSWEMVNSPVVASGVAPVAFVYVENASLEIRTRVVPVHTE